MSAKKVFADMTFALIGALKTERSQLVAKIQNNGGKICNYIGANVSAQECFLIH